MICRFGIGGLILMILVSVLVCAPLIDKSMLISIIAIWDNRSVYHAATPDYDGPGERKGSRAVSLDERPYFDPNSKSRREDMGIPL